MHGQSHPTQEVYAHKKKCQDLLHALAACLTTGMVAHAAVRGIHIEELESEIEGDIDCLKRLARFSPVLNTITHGAEVDVQVEKA